MPQVLNISDLRSLTAKEQQNHLDDFVAFAVWQQDQVLLRLNLREQIKRLEAKNGFTSKEMVQLLTADLEETQELCYWCSLIHDYHELISKQYKQFVTYGRGAYEEFLAGQDPFVLLSAIIENYRQCSHNAVRAQQTPIAIKLIQMMGREAWPALMDLIRENVPECLLFVKCIANFDMAEEARASALYQLASNSSQLVRLEVCYECGVFSPYYRNMIYNRLSQDVSRNIRDLAIRSAKADADKVVNKSLAKNIYHATKSYGGVQGVNPKDRFDPCTD